MTTWLTEEEIKALRESKKQIQAYLKDKWEKKQEDKTVKNREFEIRYLPDKGLTRYYLDGKLLDTLDSTPRLEDVDYLILRIAGEFNANLITSESYDDKQ